MDIQTIWLLVLSVATPVAGVIGFAIQLRQVAKVRLENEKLQLEIAALKTAQEESTRLVRVATTEEILMVREPTPLYSLACGGPDPGDDGGPIAAPPSRFTEVLLYGGLILLAAGFLSYLVYDLYRVIMWLARLF